jgi:CRISPR-associated protein Cas4
MEFYIPISILNDFVFCPYSIYFHNLYYRHDPVVYHDTPQAEGKLAHAAVEQKSYSGKKTIYQGMEVYSEKYGLFGKIDIYDARTHTLTERKRHIRVVYDGYVFQLYAQYFALNEMGYSVVGLFLYSMSQNKKISVPLPEENPVKLRKFENLIEKIRTFDMLRTPVPLNRNKCEKCIYNNICDLSLC